jgi:hypothetical protein
MVDGGGRGLSKAATSRACARACVCVCRCNCSFSLSPLSHARARDALEGAVGLPDNNHVNCTAQRRLVHPAVAAMHVGQVTRWAGVLE